MRAGDVIARDNGKVHVQAWKDKRVVKAISTKHDASTTTITRRIKRGGGATEEVSKPACIGDDNKCMAGVDGLDQMISYHPLTTKSVKSTTKVLFYLMEISVHNAYVLYKAKSSTKHNTMFNSCCNLLSSCCHSKRRMHRRPTMKVRMMLTCFKVCLRCNSIIFSVPFYLKT